MLTRAMLVLAATAVSAAAQTSKDLPRKHTPEPTTADITVRDVMTRTYVIADDRMTRIGRYIRDVIGSVADLDRRPAIDKPKPDPEGVCRQ